MTLVLKVDGVEVVGRVKMGEVAGLPTAAWYGEPMTGGLIIEDIDGDLDLDTWVNSWHYFTADEDDCVVGGTRLFTGWITGMRIRRGNERHATARIIDCDVLEVNGLWGLEVLRGGDASRPAETDVERITWLIGANAMDDTPVADLGRFSTSGPINLGETNYVGSFPMEVLVPTAGVAGKNVYAYWSDDDSALGIHYDLTANGPSALVAVSNDMADVDDVDTFYPYIDGELERDPSEMATGIFLRYRTGAAYGENTTLEGDLSPTEISPGAFKRDQVIDSDRIGNATTAADYVTRFLAQRDRPKEILHFTVRLPAAKVNAIHAGDILSVKFTHLPNLDPAANRVVTRRTVTQSEGRRDFYDLALECADYEIVSPGGGGTGGLPHPPPSNEHWWSGSGSLVNDGGPVQIGPASPPWEEGTYTASVTFSESPQPDETYASHGTVNTAPDSNAGEKIGTPITPSPGGDTTTFTGSFSVDGTGSITGDWKPITNPSFTLGDVYYFNGHTAGPHGTPQPTGISFWFDLAGSTPAPIPPDTGQWVEEDLSPPDGGQTVFTVTWPYADGSLTVWVDNLDESDAMTESDPATGEFTLAFAPTTTEQVRVRYQGR